MSGEISGQRRRAASMAKEVAAGRLEWEVFRDEWDENEDKLIGELYDHLEHQPQRGGLLGANEQEWQEYQAVLQAMLDRLERSP